MLQARKPRHGERTDVVNDLHSSTGGSQQTARAVVCAESAARNKQKTQRLRREGLTESVMFLALKKICMPTA